jgi:glycosyltransferase involved in cell wall biosynthesis
LAGTFCLLQVFLSSVSHNLEVKGVWLINLAIDAMGTRYGGGANELIGILNAAVAEKSISKITLFCSPGEKRLFRIPVADKLTQVEKPWVDKNLALRILWYEWGLGIECRKLGADLLFVSANFGRARFGVPHVTYIQQSLPFSTEALESLQSVAERSKNRARNWEMKRSCGSAMKIICQSNLMKRWISSRYEVLEEKIATVYHAPRRLDPGSPSFGTSGHIITNPGGPRILYVGSDAPYKKIDTLVQGLPLISRVAPEAEALLTLPVDHPYVSVPGLRCLGYLMDGDLAKAYIEANVLVLPSLVETVGMPALEAMSLGTPVMVADRPYAHDICEDAAIFFDPHSPEDFAEKAIHLLGDAKLRQDLIAKGYALVERRRAAEPYKKIIQILVDAVDGKGCGEY